MHILGERKRIKRRILKENPDLGTDILNCKRADLFSIQQDLTRFRRVKPQQQFHDRALPGPVEPGQHHALPCTQLKRHILQCIFLGVRVAEEDMLKAD